MTASHFLVSSVAFLSMISTAAPFSVPTPQSTKPVVISEDSMDLSYDTLAARLEEVLESLPESKQYWVGIAGGPGSGKLD